MNIKIIVTQERFDEIFSIEDSLHPLDMSTAEMYDYMTQFVAGEDGAYLSQADARKLFKLVKRKELLDYLTQFSEAVKEAFVPKASGAASEEQSSPG